MRTRSWIGLVMSSCGHLLPADAAVFGQIAHTAWEALAGSGAGIALLSGAAVLSVGVTAAWVQVADQAQGELGQGPFVPAAADRTVIAEDLAADRRWPRWGAAATGLGVRSVLCAALRVEGRRVGALSLYGRQPRAFSADEIGLAQLFARQAAATLRSTNP